MTGQLSANVKMTGQVLYKGKMGGSSRDGVGIVSSSTQLATTTVVFPYLIYYTNS